MYIGKKPLRMATSLKRAQLDYRYTIIDMHRVDCNALLSNDSPDAWILAVLCDFKGCAPRDIVHSILSRLMERLNDQPPRLREYVSMLEILASNRNLELNISEEFEMLRIDFEKLPTYRMGMKKGEEVGIEKGIEKGVEKGAHQRALAIAAKLMDEGLEPDWIASITNVSMAELEDLAKAKQN
ncbi:MAG: hypothetical protein ACRER2_03345 [Methylococcales bacterium]